MQAIDVIKTHMNQLSMGEHELNWNIEEVDHHIQAFLEAKTDGAAQSTCEAHQLGCFESYRLLGREFGPITNNTKGALATQIVTLMKNTAEYPKQLKNKYGVGLG